MNRTIENLKKNGFTVTEFDTAAQAADYLVDAIHGKTVGMGGSVTLQGMGVYERLGQDNQVFWHLMTPGDDTALAADNAQVYITSANAISEEGFILNIDGRGNRVAGTLMKKEKVYFVVGQNKLSGPFQEALTRARNIASPQNSKRLAKKTPCAVEGKQCFDCRSPERICNALVVFWRPTFWCEDMEVVLIHEDLGY